MDDPRKPRDSAATADPRENHGAAATADPRENAELSATVDAGAFAMLGPVHPDERRPHDEIQEAVLDVSYAGRGNRRRWAPYVFISTPVGVLLTFFAGPLAVLAVYSFQVRSRGGDGSFTLDNYRAAVQPNILEVAGSTFVLATISMLILLVLAYPLAYFIALKVGRWEIPLLLALALSDELNPLIRIFGWRTILARNGLVNTVLQNLGITQAPLDWLLFTRFSVVLVLTASWMPYAVIPLYAAMKTIDRRVLEAASDLGAGWFTTFRTVILPLTATGFVATMVIVFIPIVSDFATPGLVGGTSGRMLASVIEDLFTRRGEWGVGSALTFLLLIVSGVVVYLSYRIARIRNLDTST